MAKKAKPRKKAAKKSSKKPKAAKKAKAALRERPVTLTIASLAFALSGVINLLLFSYLMMLSDPAKLEILDGNAKLYALVPGVLGILDFVAAYGLWNMKLYGGIVGVIDLAASILVGFYPQPSFDIFSIALFLANIFLLVLVVINWKNLE